MASMSKWLQLDRSRDCTFTLGKRTALQRTVAINQSALPFQSQAGGIYTAASSIQGY